MSLVRSGWLLGSLSLVACAVADDGVQGDVSFGEAQLVLAEVPPDVRCVRVTAVGPGRTVVRELEPAASAQTTLTALPIGAVAFTGDAFTAACDSVTARTVPAWVSETETVTIAPGRLATVALVMRQNGRAKLSVTFDDDRCAGDGGCADGGGR